MKVGSEDRTHRLVFAKEFKNKSFPDMARIISDFCDKYNVVRIFMDSQGGGRAIADLLAELESPILENNGENLYRKGRKILDLLNPSINWNSEANHTAAAMLEKGRIQFPRMPLDKVYLPDKEAAVFENLELMKKQILSIIVTPTKRFGAMHFDTPSKGQRKDLYSTFIIACYGLDKLRKERESINAKSICNVGIINNNVVGGQRSNVVLGNVISRRG